MQAELRSASTEQNNQSDSYRRGYKRGYNLVVPDSDLYRTLRDISTPNSPTHQFTQIQDRRLLDRLQGYSTGLNVFLHAHNIDLKDLSIRLSPLEILSTALGVEGVTQGLQLARPNIERAESMVDSPSWEYVQKPLSLQGYIMGFVAVHAAEGIVLKGKEVPQDDTAYEHYRKGRRMHVSQPVHGGTKVVNDVLANQAGIKVWLSRNGLEFMSPDLFDIPGVAQVFKFIVSNPSFNQEGDLLPFNLPRGLRNVPGALKGERLGRAAVSIRENLRRNRLGRGDRTASVLK